MVTGGDATRRDSMHDFRRRGSARRVDVIRLRVYFLSASGAPANAAFTAARKSSTAAAPSPRAASPPPLAARCGLTAAAALSIEAAQNTINLRTLGVAAATTRSAPSLATRNARSRRASPPPPPASPPPPPTTSRHHARMRGHRRRERQRSLRARTSGDQRGFYPDVGEGTIGAFHQSRRRESSRLGHASVDAREDVLGAEVIQHRGGPRAGEEEHGDESGRGDVRGDGDDGSVPRAGASRGSAPSPAPASARAREAGGALGASSRAPSRGWRRRGPEARRGRREGRTRWGRGRSGVR